MNVSDLRNLADAVDLVFLGIVSEVKETVDGGANLTIIPYDNGGVRYERLQLDFKENETEGGQLTDLLEPLKWYQSLERDGDGSLHFSVDELRAAIIDLPVALDLIVIEGIAYIVRISGSLSKLERCGYDLSNPIDPAWFSAEADVEVPFSVFMKKSENNLR